MWVWVRVWDKEAMRALTLTTTTTSLLLLPHYYCYLTTTATSVLPYYCGYRSTMQACGALPCAAELLRAKVPL